MKIIQLGTAALLLVLTYFPNSTAEHSALQNGLVAYYSFNDCDARDETGNGSDGALYGDVGCWCGVEDDGLLLDGIDDYIEFAGPVNRYFNTSDFTISFYFRPEQYLVFRQSLLSKREGCEQYNMLDLLLDMSSQEVVTEVYENPTKFYPGLTPTLDTTQWVHFALAREGTFAYTYVNGRLARRALRCSGVDISNSALFSFGNSPCVRAGNARRFKGVLDELRVYNRALTEDEIWELYRQYPVEEAQIDCVT